MCSNNKKMSVSCKLNFPLKEKFSLQLLSNHTKASCPAAPSPATQHILTLLILGHYWWTHFLLMKWLLSRHHPKHASIRGKGLKSAFYANLLPLQCQCPRCSKISMHLFSHCWRLLHLTTKSFPRTGSPNSSTTLAQVRLIWQAKSNSIQVSQILDPFLCLNQGSEKNSS